MQNRSQNNKPQCNAHSEYPGTSTALLHWERWRFGAYGPQRATQVPRLTHNGSKASGRASICVLFATANAFLLGCGDDKHIAACTGQSTAIGGATSFGGANIGGANSGGAGAVVTNSATGTAGGTSTGGSGVGGTSNDVVNAGGTAAGGSSAATLNIGGISTGGITNGATSTSSGGADTGGTSPLSTMGTAVGGTGASTVSTGGTGTGGAISSGTGASTVNTGGAAFGGTSASSGGTQTGGASPLSTGGISTGGTSIGVSTTGTSAACVAAAPPPPAVFMVEDFERGPGLQEVPPNNCTQPAFSGLKPPGVTDGSACAPPGPNSSSCSDVFYCEGNGLGGICPEYIGCDKTAWRGNNSLRVFYNVDKNGGAFAGIIFNAANTQAPNTQCVVNRAAIDLSKFEYLSVRVRPGDAKGNAEIAIQDANGLETNPKAVITSLGGTAPPQGQWTEVKFPICSLLKTEAQDGGPAQVNRTAITKVLVDFAKQRFIDENTDLSGTRQLDIDDILFWPCPKTGCLPCP